MQAVSAGDIFFMESPIHTTDQDAEKEKILAYLLGTISSRPVVVIRGPAWWDQFDTVTVLPALTKGSPAVNFKLYDRHGNLTKATYPFIPHQPYTVPVSRLGRFIGRMEPNELEELLEAFQYIHDPYARFRENKKPVPPCYRNVIGRTGPTDGWREGDPRQNPEIYLDKPTGAVYSTTHPEINGLQVTDPQPRTITPTKPSSGFITQVKPSSPKLIPAAVTNESSFIPITEDRLPIVSDKVEERTVPVEKPFPPSIFDIDTLNRIAGRFTFSDAYYRHEIRTRNPDVLTDAEVERIQMENSRFDYDRIVDIYRTFLPMDAYVLGPRLPSTVLADICGLTLQEAVMLKHLCNVMRDMKNNIYDQRIAELNATEPEIEEEGDDDTDDESSVGYKELKRCTMKVRPYLTAKKIMSMPPAVGEAFLKIPKYQVKAMWTGPMFDRKYDEAVKKYKK